MKAGHIERTLLRIRKDLSKRERFRMDGCSAQKYRGDDDEGGVWFTSKNGHRIHINENGDVDKGNPYVVEMMEDAEFKMTQKVLKNLKTAQNAKGGKQTSEKKTQEKAGPKTGQGEKHKPVIDWEKHAKNSQESKTKGSELTDTGPTKEKEKTVTKPAEASSAKPVLTEMANGIKADPSLTEETVWERMMPAGQRTFMPMKAYNHYIEKVRSVWKGLKNSQRISLNRYTSDEYKKFNNALRDGGEADPDVRQVIEDVTNAIDQSVMDEENVLHRGIGSSGCSKLFGVSEEDLMKDPSVLVGRVGTDQAFGSCSSSSMDKSIYSEKNVQMMILAPKGTKAIYAEPFSRYGQGAGMWKAIWDGEGTQDSVSPENETILQRGTSYQIVSADKMSDGLIHVKAVIIDQTYDRTRYNKE